MNLFKDLNPKQLRVVKIVGGVFGIFVVFAILLQLSGESIPTLMRRGKMISLTEPSIAPGYPMDGYAQKMMGEGAVGYGGGVTADMAMPPTALSVRNIAPMPPSYGGTTGNDAEQFEVKNYNGLFETRNLEETCGGITALKSLSYVTFEYAQQGDKTCDFTFKVDKAHLNEIIDKLKALDPKELSEQAQTIKRQLSDFTNQLEILQNKQKSIEDTLKTALTAYDEISALATRTQDAESLTRIIDSKIQIIERLTQQRIAVSEQIDMMTRAKAEQLDRLDYVYFSVHVYESKFVDGQDIKDSWKAAIKEFVTSLNEVIQGFSINLILLVFLAAQYVLYLLILLVVIKYVWKWAKSIWKN